MLDDHTLPSPLSFEDAWHALACSFVARTHVIATTGRLVELEAPSGVPRQGSLVAFSVATIWWTTLHPELNPLWTRPGSDWDYYSRFEAAATAIRNCEAEAQHQISHLHQLKAGYDVSRFLALLARAPPMVREYLCGAILVGRCGNTPSDPSVWKCPASGQMVLKTPAAGRWSRLLLQLGLGTNHGETALLRAGRPDRVLTDDEFAAICKTFARQPGLPYGPFHVTESDPNIAFPTQPAWRQHPSAPIYDSCRTCKDVMDRVRLPRTILPTMLWDDMVSPWFADEYGLNRLFELCEAESIDAEVARLAERGPIYVGEEDGGDTRALRKRHFDVSYAKRRARNSGMRKKHTMVA
ncbi:hypothetical protein BDZ88DRAFT_62776 [Geranomyces variabilis]|nr:hypothetical protein BDZ88DRAFT_62776 [Geranomyces variabilis]KAJ3132813.1 hypothetical protein HDU90_006703 [Geranomyces variabilis]